MDHRQVKWFAVIFGLIGLAIAAAEWSPAGSVNSQRPVFPAGLLLAMAAGLVQIVAASLKRLEERVSHLEELAAEWDREKALRVQEELMQSNRRRAGEPGGTA